MALLASMTGAGVTAREPLAVVIPESASQAATDAFAARVLELHNLERSRVGMPPLTWSRSLTDEARHWALVMARNRIFAHSPATMRGDEGENLFKGTAGGYTIDEMIGGFIDERADFHPGRFPDVSRDGNWETVGHYTQMIWRQTREVGCATVRSGGWDYLVCRYAPAGNVIGMMLP